MARRRSAGGGESSRGNPGALLGGIGAIGGGLLSGIGARDAENAVNAELQRQGQLQQGFQDERLAAGAGMSGNLAGIGTQELQNQIGFLGDRLGADRNFSGDQIQGQFQSNLDQALGDLSFLNPTGQAGQVQAQAGQQLAQQQLQPGISLLGQQGIEQQLGGLDAGLLQQLQLMQAPLAQNAQDVQSSGQFNLADIGLRQEQALGDSQFNLERAGDAGSTQRLLGSLLPLVTSGIGGFI